MRLGTRVRCVRPMIRPHPSGTALMYGQGPFPVACHMHMTHRSQMILRSQAHRPRLLGR